MARAWLAVSMLLCGCSALVTSFTFVDVDAGGADASAPSAPPLLRSPRNGEMTGSTVAGSFEPPRDLAVRPVFRWEPVSGADDYEIELAACEVQELASCTFSSGTLSERTSETVWQPGIALGVSALAPVGRRYVWHVRACNAAGCSDFSETRYLEVGRQSTDFNGDGHADVLLGHWDDGASGRVLIHDGPDIGPQHTVSPGSGETNFGYLLAPAGDLDFDGYSDAIVLGESSPSGSFVRWLRGSSTSLHLATTDPRAITMVGSAIALVLAGTCELDGDGFPDFVFADDTPSVQVIYGNPARAATTIDPPSTGGFFGGSATCTSDLNGDGYTDLVVAASGDTVDTMTEAGRVYVYLGGPDGVATAPSIPLQSPTPVTSGVFGFALATGDLDDDGFGDVVVSAKGEGTGGLHVVWGGRTLPSEVTPIPAPMAGVDFGWVIRIGRFGPSARLAVSAPATVVGGIAGAGEVRLYRVDATRTFTFVESVTALEPALNARFGTFLAVVGDVVGGGFGEGLVVAAPYDDTIRTDAGSVQAFIAAPPTDTRALLPYGTYTSSDGQWFARLGDAVGSRSFF